MVQIETFVVIDLETTGLPHLESNSTKITEMCLLAASREDIKNTAFGELPPMCKLSFMLNPEKSITPNSAQITGITDDMVKNSPTFKEKFNTLKAFLQDLKRPLCLVAHNGNIFDYKILLAECNDAKLSLPDNLLCIDSLAVFKKIPSPTMQPETTNQKPKSTDTVDKSMNFSRNDSSFFSDIMTDDEDEWPELNVTQEDLEDIDKFCSSFSNISTTHHKPKKQKKKETVKKDIGGKERVCYKLTDIYKRYFGENDKIAHRAEGDCLMLLQCIVAEQKHFFKYSDDNCKFLTDCTPLERKGTFKK